MTLHEADPVGSDFLEHEILTLQLDRIDLAPSQTFFILRAASRLFLLSFPVKIFHARSSVKPSYSLKARALSRLIGDTDFAF
ncbi:hypothetical protein BMI90_18270 [Thioclava sp. L04-15]|nr:hypothetical protein BMI90_18270 [Thioclava sp. L04-15]